MKYQTFTVIVLVLLAVIVLGLPGPGKRETIASTATQLGKAASPLGKL